MNLGELLLQWKAAIVGAGALAAALTGGLVAHYILFSILRRAGARRRTVSVGSIASHCHAPARLVICVAAIDLVLPALGTSEDTRAALGHIVGLVLIGGVAWLLTSSTGVVEDVLLAKYRTDESDNLNAGKIYTQLQIFRPTIGFIVTLLAGATMLTTFGWARQLGTSLLASAGVAGLVTGIAARPAISNLVAGIQIALTEPIRIDDVVIVEGEWGWIEEILITYVVVRTWDLRRLIVPISYFVEKPFQNWTRKTADLLGTVHLYVDYTCPIDLCGRS